MNLSFRFKNDIRVICRVTFVIFVVCVISEQYGEDDRLCQRSLSVYHLLRRKLYIFQKDFRLVPKRYRNAISYFSLLVDYKTHTLTVVVL